MLKESQMVFDVARVCGLYTSLGDGWTYLSAHAQPQIPERVYPVRAGFFPVRFLQIVQFDWSTIRFVYQLAALDFKADNYVDLEGMDYLDRNTHYLAIKVDNNGEASLDNENLANLLQISMKASNEANKGKFE